ncbi:unnamed protein product [Caenorhabditis angaria]|uniref:Uncharacterized protein n=1 Tax=Caenorhabditis angaria TaxID=860376 RepID=A0A9P1J2U2_9PELO|nr:unnamed protein product [Caenorhabditis angaria]
MSNGYKNQPISGFTGYIPGAKWQVGSRYVPQQQHPSQNQKSQQKPTEEYDQSLRIPSSTNQSMSQMRNEKTLFAEMSNDELREKLAQMQLDMQNLQMAISRDRNNYESMEFNNETRNHPSNQQQNSHENKQRSKSVPRKIETNPFDGIESGWWSKGEVKRNQERRQIANGGQIVSGGNWSQRPPSQQRQSRKFRALDQDSGVEDIPAAGYSGHIQGLKHIGVGKPFNLAAKQAKKEYIERRRTYSGSRDIVNGKLRGVQYSDEEVLTNTVKLPDNHFN